MWVGGWQVTLKKIVFHEILSIGSKCHDDLPKQSVFSLIAGSSVIDGAAFEKFN